MFGKTWHYNLSYTLHATDDNFFDFSERRNFVGLSSSRAPKVIESPSKLMTERSSGTPAVHSSVGSFGTDPDGFVLYQL
jgi:hypothetical protein